MATSGMIKIADLKQIAEVFTSSTPCVAGRYYINAGTLYKCKTAHNGAWDAAHFEEVKIGDEVSDFVNNLIVVSDEQPVSTKNKIWIDSDSGSVQVPTYTEFSSLADDISDMNTATSAAVGKALKAKTVSNGKVTEWEFGDGGVLDYTDLTNKPQINGVTITGNKTTSDLGLYSKPSGGIPSTDIASGVIPAVDNTLSTTGAAADAKKTGDEISSLKSALTANLLLKINKPSTNPDGTSGQLLRTNGDGTTTWVDEGLPTDAQTAEAVEAWLDDHPEATTTVQDGAITMPKLNSALKSVVVVEDSTEKAFYHNVIPTEVTVYPNAYTQDIPIRYVGSKDLLKEVTLKQGSQAGLTVTNDGRYFNLLGTTTGGITLCDDSNAAHLTQLAGKTVNVCLYIKKSTPWENNKYFYIRTNNTYPVNSKLSTLPNGMMGWVVFQNIEMPSELTRFALKFNDIVDCVFANGDFIWVAVYESTPIVTETTITNEPASFNISGLSYIDTMMHESVAKYIVPTKTYVDEHTPDIIGYWTENVYVMPEHFGAIGDGIVDDTQAITDCISYAVTNNKQIKGFRRYKTSSTVVLSVRYMDVYLREIIYTGNDAAVELQNQNIVFDFYKIQSSGTGINFYKNTTDNRNAHFCRVSGNQIVSSGDCIVAQMNTLYNTCEIRYLSSENGSCVVFVKDGGVNDFVAHEYVFRSSSCQCPNGYAIKNAQASKFYDFTIEGNCKYGFLNPSTLVCVGFRHREFTDRMYSRIFNNAEYDNGPYITITDVVSDGRYNVMKYMSVDSLPWFHIDVSAIDGYDEFPASTPTNEWLRIGYTGIDLGITISGVVSDSRNVLGERLYIIGGNKVVAPNGRKEVSIDSAEVRLTLLDSQVEADIYSAKNVVKYLGTDFNISVAHSDIYLNAYFGAIGYNDLTVTQANGNTCTIYDKLGNTLFDGTNEGNGKWSLKCSMNRSSFGRHQGVGLTWWCYDGTNETWEITKLS